MEGLKRLMQGLQITWFQCCSGKPLMFSVVSPRDLRCTYTDVYYFVLKTLTEFNKSKQNSDILCKGSMKKSKNCKLDLLLKNN